MSAGWSLAVTVVLLAINAFFVAGEFAVTSTRRSQIEPLADAGERRAGDALYALRHVSLMLAICQLGVTVASTTLGVVAEPAIAHLVESPLARLGAPEASSLIVVAVTVVALALVIVLFCHVVFGEMVPKNISIAAPVRMLLLLAPVLVRLGRVLRPIIAAMDRFANWFVRLAGYEPRSEIASTYTAQEVASIVEASQAEGKITDELGLLSGALEFSEETAGSAMVPLSDLVSLPAGATPADVEDLVAHTGYSRFPVAGEDGAIVGYVHLKDVLYASGEERDQPITPWRIRRLESVAREDQVEDALRHMQRTGVHCALVREGGEVLGILFLEDILELLVGEVRDVLQRP